MATQGVKMSERELQDAVIELAQTLGWRVAHFRPARVKRGGREIYETPVSADGRGFPDLVMARGPRVVIAELKSSTGKLRPDQELWVAAFRQTSIETFVWEPSRWLDGTIEQVLR